MAIQLTYAEDEPTETNPKRFGMPTVIGVACWMIAIFVLAMTLLA